MQIIISSGQPSQGVGSHKTPVHEAAVAHTLQNVAEFQQDHTFYLTQLTTNVALMAQL